MKLMMTVYGGKELESDAKEGREINFPKSTLVFHSASLEMLFVFPPFSSLTTLKQKKSFFHSAPTPSIQLKTLPQRGSGKKEEREREGKHNE
jgi:hypothetical protein